MTRTPTPPPSRRSRRAQARLEHPPQRARAGHQPAARPIWRSPMALVSAAAVILGAILVLIATRPSTGGGELVIPPTSYAADLVDGGTMGSKTAPVVIEIFADFQCPACKQLVTSQLPRLVADFVKPGIARIEAQDIDIRGSSNPDESLELAAGAFCAAEQNRYWQYHDLVFWNQGRENRGDHNDAFIARVADQAGLDMTAWKACNARTDIRQPIKTRTAAAFAAGIDSTPTLRINGELFVGVPDYTKLSAAILQLAEAASPAPSSGSASTPAPS